MKINSPKPKLLKSFSSDSNGWIKLTPTEREKLKTVSPPAARLYLLYLKPKKRFRPPWRDTAQTNFAALAKQNGTSKQAVSKLCMELHEAGLLRWTENSTNQHAPRTFWFPLDPPNEEDMQKLDAIAYFPAH